MWTDLLHLASGRKWPRSDVEFRTLCAHPDTPAVGAVGGRVVLSQLTRGSRFTAIAASVKFVLEGEATYEIDGRTPTCLPPRMIGFSVP